MKGPMSFRPSLQVAPEVTSDDSRTERGELTHINEMLCPFFQDIHGITFPVAGGP
jgi:hypothetical protein